MPGVKGGWEGRWNVGRESEYRDVEVTVGLGIIVRTKEGVYKRKLGEGSEERCARTTIWVRVQKVETGK